MLRIARADLAGPRSKFPNAKTMEHVVVGPFQLERRRDAGKRGMEKRERGSEEETRKLCLMAWITHRRSPDS